MSACKKVAMLLRQYSHYTDSYDDFYKLSKSLYIKRTYPTRTLLAIYLREIRKIVLLEDAKAAAREFFYKEYASRWNKWDTKIWYYNQPLHEFENALGEIND